MRAEASRLRGAGRIIMSRVPVTLGSDVLFDRGLLAGRTVGLVCNPGVDRRAVRATSSTGAEAAGVRLGRDLRSAARLPIGRAGEHDRDRPHARDRGGACRSTRSTARRGSRPRRCSPDSTHWSSICRMSARASTPTSTRWPTACGPRARTACPSIVCDRPNPIGGVAVEGPMLDAGFESFVGQFPIPMRHGMTIGELARLFNDHFGIGAKLEVVRDARLVARTCTSTTPGCRGCCRRRTCRPSTARSSIPARCCSKARNVSEGRGTTKPFELVGAPWVDPERVRAATEPPAVAGRALPAGAVRTDVSQARRALVRRLPDPCDRSRARSSRCRPAVAIIDACRRAEPGEFAWRDPPYRVRAHEAADRHPLSDLPGSEKR